MTTFALFLASVAVLLPLLHRDMTRADQERRFREWLRDDAYMAEVRRRMDALKVQIGTALLPAIERAGERMAAAIQAFAKTAATTSMTSEGEDLE